MLGAVGLLALACTSTPEQATEPQVAGDQLTIDAFRDLIQKGSLKPVDLMEPDVFQDPKPDAADEGFDAAARKLAEHAGETAQSAAPPAGQGTGPLAPQNPYLRFGKRIVVYEELGLIMKPFPLRLGLGKKMEELLTIYGSFPLYDPKAGPQTPAMVRLDCKEKWDTELFADIRGAPSEGQPIGIADWLIVTAAPDLLEQVQDFINIFAAEVPQVEIEAKIVEVTVSDALDLGVTQVDDATPIFGFPDHTFVRSLSYNLANAASGGAANALLTLGGVQNGLTFNAVLQALATHENVSIISRPKIAVREGGRAEIVNTQKLPSYYVTAINTAGQSSAGVTFEEVGIKLFVVPRVVGTDTVALNIDVESSAVSGFSTSFVLGQDSSISNPIISKRAAKTIVYLEPGQAVILGGLISERTVDSENKVPFLGDIPVLGVLFRSTSKRKEQTNVLFFIRPRILQGTDLNRDF